MSDETKTLIYLIQLNGKDFKEASDKFLKYYDEPPADGMEVNRNQAAMLGWATLLHMQTKKLLEQYYYLSTHKEFQVMVEGAHKYFFPEESKKKKRVKTDE